MHYALSGAPSRAAPRIESDQEDSVLRRPLVRASLALLTLALLLALPPLLESCSGPCCNCLCSNDDGQDWCQVEGRNVSGLGGCESVCIDYCSSEGCPDDDPFAYSCDAVVNDGAIDDDDATSDPVERLPCSPEGTFTAIGMTNSSVCGLAPDGSIVCWGTDELPDPPAGAFEQIAWRGFGCVVDAAGELTCWGEDLGGRTQAPAGSFESVDVAYQTACAVAGDASVACWGTDEDGADDAPADLFAEVSVGRNQGCAATAAGTVQCWGLDGQGQSSPPGTALTGLASGQDHVCGLDAGGGAVCWGNDYRGQASPPSGDFDLLAAGGMLTCGLRADGSAACWGDDAHGQDDEPDGSFVALATGGEVVCGLEADGGVRCWGRCED
jgi:hypothetical protein